MWNSLPQNLKSAKPKRNLLVAVKSLLHPSISLLLPLLTCLPSIFDQVEICKHNFCTLTVTLNRLLYSVCI